MTKMNDKGGERNKVLSYCLNAKSVQHIHYIFRGNVPRGSMCIWTATQSSY